MDMNMDVMHLGCTQSPARSWQLRQASPPRGAMFAAGGPWWNEYRSNVFLLWLLLIIERDKMQLNAGQCDAMRLDSRIW